MGVNSSLMSIIFERTSIRKYTNEPVSEEQVELLLKAGMAAPSARNLQPWEFVVIQNKETLNKIAQIGLNANMLSEAPLAIVVCADMNKDFYTTRNIKFWIQDCSAATENIMLQAVELGLGSVWIGTYPKEEMVEPVTKLLNLPENIVPFSVISIGYPAEKVQPKDKFDKNKIHYEKWGVNI